MDKEQQKEISYLAGSIIGPSLLAAFIVMGSPSHNCCSFLPELLMIILPGAYCFYALRNIVNIKLRAALLAFAIFSAIAVLTATKTVPPPTKQTEAKKDLEAELKGCKLDVKDNKGHTRDFHSISNAFQKGFNK